MNKVIQSLFFMSFFISFAQSSLTKSQAINIVSKQAMLIERMAKDKICKTNNINTTNSKIELASSVILFEKNIQTLKNLKLGESIKNRIIGIELLWIGYKQNILKIDKKSDKKVMNFNSIILSECNDLYQQILNSAQESKTYPYNSKDEQFTNAVINTNDLKYLSQRLALYYTSYFCKINRYDSQEFTSIVKAIDKKIDKALQIKHSNIEITEKTDELEYKWKTLKDLFTYVLDKEFVSERNSPKPTIVFDMCNKMLKDSDQLSRVYKAINDIN